MAWYTSVNNLSLKIKISGFRVTDLKERRNIFSGFPWGVGGGGLKMGTAFDYYCYPFHNVFLIRFQFLYLTCFTRYYVGYRLHYTPFKLFQHSDLRFLVSVDKVRLGGGGGEETGDEEARVSYLQVIWEILPSSLGLSIFYENFRWLNIYNKHILRQIKKWKYLNK
jgi:hypothetical protein